VTIGMHGAARNVKASRDSPRSIARFDAEENRPTNLQIPLARA
jgi:hypothetical protein